MGTAPLQIVQLMATCKVQAKSQAVLHQLILPEGHVGNTWMRGNDAVDAVSPEAVVQKRRVSAASQDT